MRYDASASGLDVHATHHHRHIQASVSADETSVMEDVFDRGRMDSSLRRSARGGWQQASGRGVGAILPALQRDVEFAERR